ncbi:MAG: RDD family protein [Phycisphaerales bacterium]|nr:RDD family protein [Phycisphaerales bacterium]MCB9863122.1 RDD family protein [Phycisphaerales bacterium]
MQLYEGFVCRNCARSFAQLRQFAYVVDWFVVATVLLGVISALRYHGITIARYWPRLPSTTPMKIELFWRAFSVNVLFLPFYFKDGFAGRSPGKWLTGLTVVDDFNLQPIDLGRSFVRNILLVIPFATLVGMAQMISGKRLGDGLANTRVIWNKYRHKFPMDSRTHVCRQCGYDLRGNASGTCPECGNRISGA